jgi:thiol-disulfide isomerase/thioredoxin
MNENKSDLKINYWFLLAVFAVIFLSSVVTAVLFARTNGMLNKKMSETAETKRPANLDLTIITDETCKDCFDVNSVLDNIKKENAKINSQKTIDSASDEGKELIAKYAIKKLPTFLASGELGKDSVLSQFFSKAGDTTDGTFVFRQVSGPYVDTTTGKIKGAISLVLLTDITCTECYDVTQHETILKQFGIGVTPKIVDVKSTLGQALVKAYLIKMVPTFVLSGDVKEYPGLTSVWSQVGFVARDGAYVFTTGVPFMGIYKNLTTNKVITPSPATTN